MGIGKTLQFFAQLRHVFPQRIGTLLLQLFFQPAQTIERAIALGAGVRQIIAPQIVRRAFHIIRGLSQRFFKLLRRLLIGPGRLAELLHLPRKILRLAIQLILLPAQTLDLPFLLLGGLIVALQHTIQFIQPFLPLRQFFHFLLRFAELRLLLLLLLILQRFIFRLNLIHLLLKEPGKFFAALQLAKTGTAVTAHRQLVPPHFSVEALAKAARRVKLGLLLAELVKAKDLHVKPEQVRTIVDEYAETFEDPKEVVRWYYSQPQRLAEAEALALENNVVNWALANAIVSETPIAFDELMGNAA